MSENLNQKSWEILFERYNILEEIENNGIFYISSEQIKPVREPRLMAKFDHTINLPPIFSKNGLSILPITRGDYAIAHFDAYHPFEPLSSDIIQASMPTHIQSININSITSETVALNCAVAAGIIADFTEDFDILPTVSGRMGSGDFNFYIKDNVANSQISVNVSNSQIEIDAAYEGVNYLTLIEAKRDISDDFLVRQLYYPYRVWQSRVAKPVKPVFLVYSNGIYHLYEYTFRDPNEYSSLEIVKQKNYSIEDTEITIDDIFDIVKNIQVKKEPPYAPFPQADSFERVINLCELICNGDYNHSQITLNYAFDGRQTNYYVSAGVYLGLIEQPERHKPYKLSSVGTAILHLNYKQRQLAFCKMILSHKAFLEVLKQYFCNGQMPEKEKIVEIMKSCDLHNVGASSTYYRRASTIRSWIEWIVSLI